MAKKFGIKIVGNIQNQNDPSISQFLTGRYSFYSAICLAKRDADKLNRDGSSWIYKAERKN